MKKLATFTVFALFSWLIFATGCANASFEKEEALRDEVFQIHDGVMPRMSEIVKLKGQLKEMQLDTVLALESNALMIQLEKAEAGMMDWMNQFTQVEKLRETKKHEEIMVYLETERQRIAKVRDDMNSSIEAAERLLKSAAGQ